MVSGTPLSSSRHYDLDDSTRILTGTTAGAGTGGGNGETIRLNGAKQTKVQQSVHELEIPMQFNNGLSERQISTKNWNHSQEVWPEWKRERETGKVTSSSNLLSCIALLDVIRMQNPISGCRCRHVATHL